MRARSTLRQSLVRSLGTLIGLAPRLDGSDADAIHRARIATRRARALLWLARPALPDPRDVAPLRTLTRALGAVRDDDVLAELARTWGLALDPRPDTERSTAIQVLKDEIANGAAFELVALAIADLDLTDQTDAAIHSRFERAARRLLRRCARVEADATDDELHRLRIDLKRIRYAASGLEVPPEVIAAFQDALARVQDRLGEYGDICNLADQIDNERRLRKPMAKARRRAVQALRLRDLPAYKALLKQVRKRIRVGRAPDKE